VVKKGNEKFKKNIGNRVHKSIDFQAILDSELKLFAASYEESSIP
jgi:hypothetical protein